jgi:hypothetical protein
MDHNEAFEHVRLLAGDSGPRLAATPAARRAEQQLTDFFAGLGLDVERQEFRQPAYSAPGASMRARLGGEWVDLPFRPVWFAGDTGPEPVRAPVVHVGNGSEGYARGLDLAGKVLLISRDSYIDYPDMGLYRRLLEWQPAAVLLTTNSGAHAPLDTFWDWEVSEVQAPPPTAVIHARDAARLVQDGAAEIEYVCNYEVVESTCANLMATLPGGESDAGNVIVSGHYDTAPSGSGAADNAAGTAVAMVLAQRLAAAAAAGDRPRRTVRFVIFSGHESGLHGPRAFVRANPRLLEETVFALNFDVLGAPIHLNMVYGAAAPSVVGSVQGVLDGLGYDWPLSTAVVPYDTYAFSGMGVPWMTLGQGMVNWLHTDADTIDRLHPSAFEAPLAFAQGVVDWAVGDAEIERGYPEALQRSLEAFSEFSGWAMPTPTAPPSA